MVRRCEMEEAYLAFAIGPEVRNHADNVIESSVGALVYQERT